MYIQLLRVPDARLRSYRKQSSRLDPKTPIFFQVVTQPMGADNDLGFLRDYRFTSIGILALDIPQHTRILCLHTIILEDLFVFFS